MSEYENLISKIKHGPQQTWLITGVAGFIGSNLLMKLLDLNQKVIGVDNFSTGFKKNLMQIKKNVTPKKWKNFTFIDGDIRNIDDCKRSVRAVDHVLHQAALGSVPRSLKDPINTNKSNIDGFLNMLIASRDENVSSFTYAASSSTYGDSENLPKQEDIIGNPLSPYAVTKYVNELYSDVFFRSYGFNSIGLRYFNVFGELQDPNGSYAAVIPKWISSIINNDEINIYGDGETSRDFCYIENVIQANLLSAHAGTESKNNIYNIAFAQSNSLNALFGYIVDILKDHGFNYSKKPNFLDFRAGDVRHSLADISKAKKLLGYDPQYSLTQGLERTIASYLGQKK